MLAILAAATTSVAQEFQHRAPMKAFREGAAGIITTPTAVEEDVEAKYGG